MVYMVDQFSQERRTAQGLKISIGKKIPNSLWQEIFLFASLKSKMEEDVVDLIWCYTILIEPLSMNKKFNKIMGRNQLPTLLNEAAVLGVVFSKELLLLI